MRLSSQKGFTVVELLISMVIAGIILAVALAVIVDSQRAGARVRDRLEAIGHGRTAMEQITQRVRAMVCLPDGVTTPVIAASANQLTFYADLDGDEDYDPARWRLTGQRDAANRLTSVREERWADAAGTGTPASRLLARNLGDMPRPGGGTLPLFRYYAYPSLEATDTVEIGTGAGGAVAAADLRRVVRVDVAFLARSSSAAADRRTASALESSVYARGVRRSAGLPTFDCTG